MDSKTGPPLSLFTRRVMCLSTIARRNRVGIDVDELIAAQDATDVAIVEDALGSGQAQRAPVIATGMAASERSAVVNLPAALENVGEQVAEFAVAILRQRAEPCRCDRAIVPPA